MKTPFLSSIRTALAALTAIGLAACGGGHASAPLVPVASSGPSAPSGPAGALTNATFQISIPNPGATTAAKRRAQYVSSATKSIKLVLTSPNIGAQGTTIVNVVVPSTACIVDPANSGNFRCTVGLQVPPGTDIFTATAYDALNATGNVLSQQTPTLTVVAGQPNTLSMTLDANAASMALSGTGNCQTGAVTTTYATVGTPTSTFSAAFTDPAGKTIAAPGQPQLAILGNDSVYHTTSGTINATGGTVAFAINQATQTFTLTPSSSAVTGATIAVHGTPASTSDGLSFTVAQSFTYSTGSAPPAHNFLAAVQQIGANSGSVGFYNVTLGGNGGTDTFTAFSPATLATTTSTNEGKPDVDNPLALTWDTGGNLLIANGGTGTGSPADKGSLACIPAGAIATGANTATTTSGNVDDPLGIAYDSRDGSVALANNPVGATVQMPEYLLTGNYTATSSPRTLVAALKGDNGVVALPTLAAGTYAAALTDGTETDTAHGGTGSSKIAILAPSGVETDISDTTTFAIDNPHGLAWDAQNSQLVIANFSSFHKLLSFYTVSPVGQVTTINTGRRNYAVAASPDGHVAVAGNGASGLPQIQVYDNTASRNPVLGPIPFNGATTSCGLTDIYPNAVVNSMTWLSNTKLLVALQSFNGSAATAQNGLYVFDITASAVPAGFDDGTCAAFAAAPLQTAFVPLSNKPLGTAFKP